MSGRLPIHVNTANRPSTKPGGVDLRMQTLPEALKTANYSSHTAGKWHAGGYFWGQLPTQRGFDTSLNYLNGMEDHYTQYFNQLGGIDLWENDGPAIGRNGTYGALMYAQHLTDAVHAHSFPHPLFIYGAWQNTHSPLEVPARFLNHSYTAGSERQSYYGMVACLDEGIRNVTEALKSYPNAWENTLFIFSADNGGETGGGGNNWPRRGGKYTDFEGGTSVAAFVSGGYLPPAVRGTSSSAIIHICDWHLTLSKLAGATPAPPTPKGVPLPDSIDAWPALSTGTLGSRTEVALSVKSLISGNHKLVTGQKAGGKNNWQNPAFPDADPSDPELFSTPGGACDPCLFDLSVVS
jgi:arylsulfatase B